MAKTLRKYGAKYNTTYCEFCGLSTDVKPITSFGGINIANGSKFVEMNTNKEFRYDADAKLWHEVSEGGGGGSATLIEKTISANGVYTAANDNADGYSTVTVNVGGGTGLPKLATPTACAHKADALYILQGLYDGQTSAMISSTYDSQSSHSLYYVIMQPISSITFEYEFKGNKGGNIVFTASSDNISIQCYFGATKKDVTYNSSSVIKKGDFKQGKTYNVSYATIPQGSSTMYETIVDVAEYDEPIAFTLE